MKSVMLFAPFSGIWPHALNESQLIRLLAPELFDVQVLECGSSFYRFCTVMESNNIALSKADSLRQSVCANCRNNARVLRRSQVSDFKNLQSFTRAGDRQLIADELRKVDRSNYIDFGHEGIPVGRIAAYEVLIKYKKTSLSLTDEQYEYYLVSLENALVTLLAGRRALSELDPSIVICYSPQYGVTGTLAACAIEQGRRVYFTEGSSSIPERYNALRIWDWARHGLVNPALVHWDADNGGQVATLDMSRVAGHIEALRAAQSFSVYSKAAEGRSTRNHFDIPDGSSLVLAAMSSYDESYSAHVIGAFPESKFKGSVYEDQVSWIRDTIRWAGQREDLHLIVRPHPRDLPNKRDTRHAEQTSTWQDLFADPPANVRVDFPEDRFPLEDHLTEVDVFLTGWSSTAIEALLRDIPVVTYDAAMPSYPSSIHLTGKSREAYFANIETALAQGRHPKRSADALDWLAYSNGIGTIRVGGRLSDRKGLTSYPFVARILAAIDYRLPWLMRRIDVLMRVDARDKKRLEKLLLGEEDSLFA